MKVGRTMPEKKSEHSLLISLLLFAVFIALAILGSYVILYVPVGTNVNTGHSSTSMERFFVDGTPPENQSQLLYLPNGSFSGTWQFSASSDVPGDGSNLMLALVDYNQTPVFYNGSLGLSHTIRYQLPVESNTSFKLTGLSEGFHDLTFLTVLDPYADTGGIPGYDFNHWIGGSTIRRFRVIEGNATKPDVRYGMGPLEKFVSYQNGSGRNLLGYGPWLTKIPFADLMSANGSGPSVNVIDHLDAAPGQVIDYYINIKNGIGPTNEYYGRFALTQLLDYEQVPIRRDTPGNVYYGALDPDEFMAIRAGINAPEAPGTHVLFLVLAVNPYEDSDLGGGVSLMTQILPVILDVKG